MNARDRGAMMYKYVCFYVYFIFDLTHKLIPEQFLELS